MNFPADPDPSGVFPSITGQDEPDQLIRSGKTILLYFSTPDCQVCHALKPRLKRLLLSDFPEIHPYFIDVAQNQEIAARFRVFTVPVIILFIQGRETIRKSRYINLEEFQQETTRLFSLLNS